MNPIKCVVIDDEPMALEKMEAYIRKTPFLEATALCESPFEAMQVMARQSVDAIFIDINMPDLNGMDFIASMTEPPMVVFTTAYAEYAVESYRLSAVDYLLKPFDFATFQRAANKLLKQHTQSVQSKTSHQDSDTLYVKVDYRYVNLKIDDILYIQGMSEYIQIHTSEQRPLIVHTSMKQIMESLPEYFLQVHRSYIVNMRQAGEIDRMRIIMNGGNSITVGDNYKKGFMEYLQTHSLGRKDTADKSRQTNQ